MGDTVKTYELACPVCDQQPGEQCKAIDGSYMSSPHSERFTAALMCSGERQFTDGQIEDAINSLDLI
jgi:hypothetical protein